MSKSISLIAVVLVTAAVISGCGSGSSSSTSGASGAAAPAAGAPASPSAGGSGTGKAVLPVAKNPIVNTSTAGGLAITKALVENNVDPGTGKGIADHLEVTLKNTTTKPLNQLEIYYTITDPAKKASEGYFTKLDGVAVASGANTVVHFDDTGKPGHFPVNKYSLYYTDKNALVVDVTASAAGIKPATFTVKKDAGGAEAGVE